MRHRSVGGDETIHDTSTYTESGSGSESSSDTSDPLSGTVTLSGSGSSSDLMHQTFGDVLASGGDIASGSLTYTDTSSETDAGTTTESGSGCITDAGSGGPSQSVTYTIITTTPDDETASGDRHRYPERRRSDRQRLRPLQLERRRLDQPQLEHRLQRR